MLINYYENYLTGPFFEATQGHNLFDLVKLGVGSYIFEKKKRYSVHFHRLNHNFNTSKRETLIMT